MKQQTEIDVQKTERKDLTRQRECADKRKKKRENRRRKWVTEKTGSIVLRVRSLSDSRPVKQFLF